MATSDIEKLHGLAAEAEILRIQFSAGLLDKQTFHDKAQKLKTHMDLILSDEHADRIRDYREIIDGTLQLLRD